MTGCPVFRRQIHCTDGLVLHIEAHITVPMRKYTLIAQHLARRFPPLDLLHRHPFTSPRIDQNIHTQPHPFESHQLNSSLHYLASAASFICFLPQLCHSQLLRFQKGPECFGPPIRHYSENGWLSGATVRNELDIGLAIGGRSRVEAGYYGGGDGRRNGVME